REGADANTDAPRGRLRLVSFATPQQLNKDGANLFSAPEGLAPLPAPAEARVLQGSLEQSNVRGVLEMTRMIEISRTYTQVASLLQSHGEMRRSAIEKLAEAPA